MADDRPASGPADPSGHAPGHTPEGASSAASLPPAFYAGPRTLLGDWWTVLHPPYTAWHLSYVLLGAAVTERVDGEILAWTLLAFFLAVGVGAHALDELHGRPLGTSLGSRVLWSAAVLSLAAAVAVGVYGVTRTGPELVPFVAVGGFLVFAYNLEWFGGRLHTTLGFALAWGAFPALTSAFAQQGRVTVPALLVAAAAAGLSGAQRMLSTPVRHVRRNLRSVEVRMLGRDGELTRGDARVLLDPVERALRTVSWSVVVLGLGLVAARL